MLAALLAAAINAAGAHAATFLVTTTADAGPGSLRQAITDANSAPGLDMIEFAISGAGVPRITPATALPAVSGPVTIDGTTQVPGGLVELDGEATTSAVGLSMGGGSSTVRGLVIGGFDLAGILITGAGDNVVEGNLIGTDASGSDGRSPLAYGIQVSGSPANRIGGTSPGSGNLVSGNLFGIFVEGSAAVGNVIEGNLIGTNASGTAAVRNSSSGIWILGASATVIGGADPAAANVVAGNGTDGIDIGGPGAVDTLVWGNVIGFGADLATPLGNGEYGVYVYGSAGRSDIGGTVGNLIGNNGDSGVRLPAGTRNSVRGNVIAANGGLGIDLGTVGVTPNDLNDLDTGANKQQNFPVLDATFEGGTQVSGTLDTASSGSFVVEVFSTSGCDPSGYGEGGELLAEVVVPTDVLGHGEFTATLSRAVDASVEHVTATATDSQGNTSEFSPCAPDTLLPTTSTTSTTSTSTTSTTTAGGPSTTTSSVPGATSTTSSSTTSTTAGGEPSTTTSTVPGATSTTSSSTTSTTAGGEPSTTTSTVPEATSTTTSSTTSTTAGGEPSTTTSTVPGATSTTSSSTTSTTAGGGPSTTTSTVPGATSTTSTTTGGGPSTTTSTAPGATSTTTSSSTTSTTPPGPSSSTTTSVAASTSTSTTLPGCLAEATFDSVRCRLLLLSRAVTETRRVLPVQDRIGRQLDQAQLLLDAAEARCVTAKRGPAKRKLARVGRQLGKVGKALQLEQTRQEALGLLAETAALLRSDTRTLARGLTCP